MGMSIGQNHGTNAWDKCMGQGLGAGPYDKCMGQVHVTRKPDMGKGMGKGKLKGHWSIDKGMG